MTTATVMTGRHTSSDSMPSVFEGIRIGRFGLGTIGFVTVLVSAWGGIVPFIGPLFGFGANGVGSWHWSAAHAVVALLPGAVGVLLGVTILAEARGIEVGRGRMSLATVGILTVLTGAWFVIGPLALPVVMNHGPYFVAASPLRNLANIVGYAMGPGLIVAVCGAFAIGWASRHQVQASAPVDALTAGQ
jgi:hypothetical protein